MRKIAIVGVGSYHLECSARIQKHDLSDIIFVRVSTNELGLHRECEMKFHGWMNAYLINHPPRSLQTFIAEIGIKSFLELEEARQLIIQKKSVLSRSNRDRVITAYQKITEK